METRRIADMTVGCVGLGCMPLSIDNRPETAAAVQVVCAALDAGMTLLDTADAYCLDDADIGHNERLVAQALVSWAGNRHGVVVATKGGLERPEGRWTVNGHPEHLVTACHRSLVALGVERIDLYQLHAPDPHVPFEDSVGALADLQRQGKIRNVGLSNVSVEQITKAQTVCSIVSVQNRFNLLDRASLTVAQHCRQAGLAFLPHSPVGGHQGHVRLGKHAAVASVAARVGATPYQVALAWLLAMGPHMLPIPGASRPQSARSSAQAASLALAAQDLAELEDAA